jgi:hypothetical protein
MIRSTAYSLPGHRNTWLLKWAVYVLAVLFFINCFSPLRIHVDMLRYFAIKDCLENNCPPTADRADYLPFGYTALLLALSKLGILRSFSIIFINCIYLLGGLYFVRKVFAYIHSPLFLFVLVLLNWTVIKFVDHPLSELQYLFFSLASIFAFYQYAKNKKIINLLMAFLFAALAFLTRTVGVALLAALCLGLIWEFRRQLLELISRNKILVAILALCMIAILIFSKQLGLNHYTGVMSKQFQEGLHFSRILKWHFLEWGELFINTSSIKASSYLPSPWGIGIFLLAGVICFAGFIYICFIKRNRIPFIVKAYLFFYLILMFAWPFYDPRFWVPVIPLMAAVIAQTSFQENKAFRLIASLLLVVYTAFGTVSMVYMTYTSLNRKAFARTEANGVYRNEYETHFFGKPLSDTATHEDPYVLDVLRRYDK